MMKILYILLGLNITVTIVSFVFHWIILGFVFLFISICTIYLLLFVKSINEDNSNCNNKDCNNYVYRDYESEPGFWAHNDSLSGLTIYRKDDVVLNDDNNTDEGW